MGKPQFSKLITSITVSIVMVTTLSGCNSSSNGVTTSASELLSGKSKLWEGTVSELSCSVTSEGQWSCRAKWQAENISNIPLEFGGLVFVVVNGKVYQSTDPRESDLTVNPGSSASTSNGDSDFIFPCGGDSTELFMANSATDERLISAKMEYDVSCEDLNSRR